MLELYHSGLTTCSKQVRLCLADKGLDYVSRYIELWRHENLSPAYLKINPHGVVPTLVHDGAAIANSFTIMEYLEDAFPDPPLRPVDPKDRARMRLWTWTADEIHPSMADATYTAFMKSHLGHLTADEVETLIDLMPVPERRERLRRVAGGGFADDEIEAAFARVDFALAEAEGALMDAPYFAGESYSLADIAMLAIIHRVNELRPAMIGNRPGLADWRDRMMARPNVARVYASGTDEAPARPARISLDGIG